jgi:hypothetical protein
MKKAAKNNLQMVALGVAGLCASAVIIYGSYWIAKHGSYFFFYEDMVKETITEMVDPKYLKAEN